MFAILQISETNTILRKPKINSLRYNLPSGDAFFIITTDKHMGKIPWKKLEKCLGILRNCILLPDSITIPDDAEITAFSPEILPKLLLINSATDCIRKHKQNYINKHLTVFDENALYINHIERLIPCFKNITVITDKTDSYNNLSAELLTDYGFSLVVSDKENFDCDVVISHECNPPVYFNGTVFTNKKKHLMNAEAFSGSEIKLPEIYENMRPENIDRILFASALYEKCGEKSIGELFYSDFNS